MPKKIKEWPDMAVRKAGDGVHAVGGVAGLLLQVKGNARSWIYRTTVGGKRSSIGLGGYPDTTLTQARDKARALKDDIGKGIDPLRERRAAREALRASSERLTFKQAAIKCHAARELEFRNMKHRKDWLSSLERFAFDRIGHLPVEEITVAHVLSVLEPIWYDRTETATRVRQRMESVLSWATVAGQRSGDNPARWADNLEHLLTKPTKVRKVTHQRAIPWQDVPEFMEKLRQREGMGARALEFAILTAARSGEVRLATWAEIDLQKKLWTVPGERMKAARVHRVPLSNDAIKLLKALPRFNGSDYVFPAPRGGALSDVSLLAVLKRMGVDSTQHGFRSCFKDFCRNRSAYPDEVSELALAHINSDATRAAYARDELLSQRTQLMGAWADYLREPHVDNVKALRA